MRLKITIVLLAILSLAAIRTKGQNRPVIITGRIDTSFITKFSSNELLIVINTTTNLESVGIVKKLPIQENGDFKTSIQHADTFLYISFEMVHGSYNDMLLNINYLSQRKLKQVYLFQQGDSVKINIQKNGMFKFQGRGSEKLNCQSKIYSMQQAMPALKIRENELAAAGKLKDMLLFRQKQDSLSVQMQLEILNSYVDQLPDHIFTLIYLDVVASSKYEMLESLLGYFFMSKDSSSAYETQQFYRSYLLNEDFANIDSALLSESAYYADMIFEKELNSFALYKNRKLNSSYMFKEVYDKISNSYKGKLREKLLIICFQRLSKRFFSEAKSLINSAVISFKHPEYIDLLTNWKNRQYSAFPFELMDTKDQIHRLKDYKGKVLVIDFWYTGCVWCSVLNTSMRPIVERYKGNNNIVFLTVCLDKQKEKWLKSLQGGKYTSSGTIDLFTMGLGIGHPLIQHYNFRSFPQQLIIGKGGTLISSHPPRVDVGAENVKKFLNIIDTVLYQ